MSVMRAVRKRSAKTRPRGGPGVGNVRPLQTEADFRKFGCASAVGFFPLGLAPRTGSGPLLVADLLTLSGLSALRGHPGASFSPAPPSQVVVTGDCREYDVRFRNLLPLSGVGIARPNSMGLPIWE